MLEGGATIRARGVEPDIQRSVRSCAAVAISGRRRISRAEPASEPRPALVRRVLVIAWLSLPAEEPDCGRGADHEDSDENARLEQERSPRFTNP